MPRILLAAFFVTLLSHSAMASYVSECAAALKDDLVQQKSNYSIVYAYLKTVTDNEQDFEKAKASGALDIIIEDLPIGASLDLETTRQYIRDIESHTTLNFQQSRQEGFLSYTLSNSGAAAFADCNCSTRRQDGRPL